jgi:hypothetical protein
MAHSGIADRDRIKIAAVVRAAGRGLLSAAEAEVLIERIRARTTTPPPETGISSRQVLIGQFDDRDSLATAAARRLARITART